MYKAHNNMKWNLDDYFIWQRILLNSSYKSKVQSSSWLNKTLLGLNKNILKTQKGMGHIICICVSLTNIKRNVTANNIPF